MAHFVKRSKKIKDIWRSCIPKCLYLLSFDTLNCFFAMHERDFRRYIFDTVWVADLDNADCFLGTPVPLNQKVYTAILTSIKKCTQRYYQSKVYTAILTVQIFIKLQRAKLLSANMCNLLYQAYFYMLGNLNGRYFS